jgi:stage II sporulation protein D
MKRTFDLVIFFFIIFFFSGISTADDKVRVLIHEDPSIPIPSEKSENIEHLNGKIFLNGNTYTGDFEIKKDKNGLRIISTIPFEKYIEGVVTSETGKDWEIEALKAQAVISRTYAVFHKGVNDEKEFHLTSGVLHQLYKEENKDPLVTFAVNETEGEVLTYNGSAVESFYHSICYGKTELPEEVWGKSYPYLEPVECNNKKTPYENWQRKFAIDDMERTFNINKIADISIASLTATGRANTIRITGDDGKILSEINATELRKVLGYKKLPSTDFSITKESGGFVFQGKGWGHGVGLSQWGALEMAREGKNYRDILAHYYPGTLIEKQAGHSVHPAASKQDNKNNMDSGS